MKKNIALLLSLTLGLTAVCAIPASETRAESSKELIVLETPTGSEEMDTTGTEAVTMFRLYNPNSGEHFYTKDESEKAGLVKEGWNDEGIGWIAPAASNTPVYRLYNENAGDHHYTMNKKERDGLVVAGWNDEGIGWYSDDEESVPLYREYNPNAVSGTHNYTKDKAEHYNLVKAGWADEGIGWYGIPEKKIEPLFPDAKVGDYVTFGTYEQDNDLTNGAEPIEWQYIADKDGHKYLLSKYALDAGPYNDKPEKTTWENCTLRKWLNEDFYDTAFSANEKEKIVTAYNENPDSYELFKRWNSDLYTFGAEGGNATADKVFLLSYEEAKDYLDGEYDWGNDIAYYSVPDQSPAYNPKLIGRPTAYAKERGVWNPYNNADGCWWWLRSQGPTINPPMKLPVCLNVHHEGAVYHEAINDPAIAIRPAILID